MLLLLLPNGIELESITSWFVRVFVALPTALCIIISYDPPLSYRSAFCLFLHITSSMSSSRDPRKFLCPFRSSLVRFRSCLFVVGGLVSSN